MGVGPWGERCEHNGVVVNSVAVNGGVVTAQWVNDRGSMVWLSVVRN